MKHAKYRTLVVMASAALFVASLTQPGFYVANNKPGEQPPPGILLLLVGWAAVADGKLAWFANPLLFKGWRATQREESAAVPLTYAVAALVLALSFLLHHQIMVSEAGHRSDISAYGYGFWLWLSSIGTLVLGNLIRLVDSSS